MLSYDNLEKAVMQFVMNSKQESFDAEELAADLDPQSAGEERENTIRRICNILDSCEFVARKHSSDLYYILNNFFRGTSFLCKPRPVELERGIFIPAARLEPFHPAELYADELEFASGKVSAPFELTEVRLPYKDVSDLFFMLGPAGTIDMLVAESQENHDAIRDRGGLSGSMPVLLEAFNFSEFYRNTGFRNGDYIRFEIKSWADGEWKISHVSRIDSPTPQEIDRWIDKFENALTDVCFDYKDSLEIHEQIMYAYIYAAASGNDIRKLPGPAIDLYHNMMQTISFRRDGSEWTLISNDALEDTSAKPEEHLREHGDEAEKEGHEHHEGHAHGCACGHDHSHVPQEDGPFGDMSPNDFSASKGSMESIDAILHEIHAPVHETELQAYMLDTIASGAESFEEFERVHEDLIKFTFTDDAQEAAYLNFVEELWETLADRYSHNIDSPKAPLRQRLLELTDRRIELSAIVLEHKGAVPPEELKSGMVHVHREILDTLFILNRDAVLEPEEIADLDLRVGDIENEFEIVTEKISDWLEKSVSGGRE